MHQLNTTVAEQALHPTGCGAHSWSSLLKRSWCRLFLTAAFQEGTWTASWCVHSATLQKGCFRPDSNSTARSGGRSKHGGASDLLLLGWCYQYPHVLHLPETDISGHACAAEHTTLYLLIAVLGGVCCLLCVPTNYIVCPQHHAGQIRPISAPAGCGGACVVGFAAAQA